ncbi:MAG: hypothetical protein ACI4JQ_05710, partial [Ruminococcus sp.]
MMIFLKTFLLTSRTMSSTKGFFSLQTFHRNVCKIRFASSLKQGGAVLFAPPRNAVAFLTTLSARQKNGAGVFRRLRTATRGFAP